MRENWKQVATSLKKSDIIIFNKWLNGEFTRNSFLREFILVAINSNFTPKELFEVINKFPRLSTVEQKITTGEEQFSELLREREKVIAEIAGLENYREKMKGEILQFVKSIPPPVPMILPPNPPFPFINAGTEVVKEEVESSKEEEELVEEEKKTTPRFRISSSG